MLGINALADLVALVITFQRVPLISNVIDSPESVDMGAVEVNDNLSQLSGGAQTLTYLVTAVLFVVWLFRARSNAESIMLIPHRRHSAWIVFGWITPIVSWWFPKQIIDDIWTTSKLGGQGFDRLGNNTLQTARRSGLVRAWWISWVVSMWLSNVFYRAAARGKDLDSLLSAAKIEIYFAIPTLICTVLAATMVLKITTFQDSRRMSPTPAI